MSTNRIINMLLSSKSSVTIRNFIIELVCDNVIRLIRDDQIHHIIFVESPSVLIYRVKMD